MAISGLLVFHVIVLFPVALDGEIDAFSSSEVSPLFSVSVSLSKATPVIALDLCPPEPECPSTGVLGTVCFGKLDVWELEVGSLGDEFEEDVDDGAGLEEVEEADDAISEDTLPGVTDIGLGVTFGFECSPHTSSSFASGSGDSVCEDVSCEIELDGLISSGLM